MLWLGHNHSVVVVVLALFELSLLFTAATRTQCHGMTVEDSALAYLANMSCYHCYAPLVLWLVPQTLIHYYLFSYLSDLDIVLSASIPPSACCSSGLTLQSLLAVSMSAQPKILNHLWISAARKPNTGSVITSRSVNSSSIYGNRKNVN